MLCYSGVKWLANFLAFFNYLSCYSIISQLPVKLIYTWFLGIAFHSTLTLPSCAAFCISEHSFLWEHVPVSCRLWVSSLHGRLIDRCEDGGATTVSCMPYWGAHRSICNTGVSFQCTGVIFLGTSLLYACGLKCVSTGWQLRLGYVV